MTYGCCHNTKNVIEENSYKYIYNRYEIECNYIFFIQDCPFSQLGL
jgi:hypothetical protein